MKAILFFLFFTFFGSFALAQEAQKIIYEEVAIATIDLANGRITQAPSFSTNSSSAISNLRLSIRTGDVILNFDLKALEKPDQYYVVTPRLRLNGQDLTLSPYDDLRGDLNRLESGGSKQIVWLNPLERHAAGNLEGNLEFILPVDWYYFIEPLYPCEEGEPQFTSAQRLPYYLAGGAGVAAIVAGQIVKAQKDNNYEEYLNSKTLDEATPYYEDANRQNKTAQILTYTGAGILVVDAILYFIRQRQYKKNLDAYNKYCRDPNLSFRPVWDAPSPVAPEGLVGLQINLRF